MDYTICCTYALFDSLLYRLKYDSYDVSSERNCAGNTMNVVSAAIFGIAGIGHILLGIALILILIQIKLAGKDEAPCLF